MATRDPIWRIVTNEFSFVKRAPNFFRACEHARDAAAQHNVIINGVFELDVLTMRRRLSNHELERLKNRAPVDMINEL